MKNTGGLSHSHRNAQSSRKHSVNDIRMQEYGVSARAGSSVKSSGSIVSADLRSDRNKKAISIGREMKKYRSLGRTGTRLGLQTYVKRPNGKEPEVFALNQNKRDLRSIEEIQLDLKRSRNDKNIKQNCDING